MNRLERTLTQVFIAILGIALISVGVENTRQNRRFGFIEKRLSQMESNHVQLVESLSKWNVDENDYDDVLLQRIKEADETLNMKIENLKRFNDVVIVKLQTIADIQSGFIKSTLGLVSTNLVDMPE